MAQGHDLKPIKKLDAGGMAEVYLAEIVGPKGISKRVAVKKILPHLAKHEKFVSMFLDEARLAMNLSHANIVQTFDVGINEGSYFIVMEYIEGTSLKKILNHYGDRNRLLPVSVAVYIAIEAGKGLAYAHTAKDAQGRPLKIVHRDVSPPNILLSTQGEVKVVDFGLAKAASQLENTEPGIIKGKFSYLAPEALQGLELDHRADIFSLGIVLFEMLTGRRLFYGATDLETVKQVERAYVPNIMALNPDVPFDLDRVVRKALQKDRNKRYQTCDEFVEALNNVLFSHGMRVNSGDIAKIVKEVLASDSGTAQGSPSFSSSSLDFVKGFSLSNDVFEEVDDDDIEEISAIEVIEEDDEVSGVVDPREWLNDLDLDDELGGLPFGDSPAGDHSHDGDEDVVLKEPPRRTLPQPPEKKESNWGWLESIIDNEKDDEDGEK